MLEDERRLAALHRSGLLDLGPEHAFDRLTALAKRFLGVPVVQFSLVTQDREIAKSLQGGPQAAAVQRECSLSRSFCQHVVASDAPLVVNDARLHPLVSDNLAVLDLSVAAYLGVPIHSPDGHTLGSLCAIDTEPRVWTADDEAVLRDLAESVESEIALRTRYEATLRGSQESLSQNQARLKAVFEGSLDAMFLAGDDARFVDVNPAAAALLGYTREELLGMSVRDIWAPEMREGFDERWAARRAMGVRAGESAFQRKDGTRVEAEQRATFNVLPGLHLSVIRDVTERKASEAALAEASARTAEILESINDGFYALDADWRFTYVNAQAGAFLGQEPEGLIGQVAWKEFPAALDSPFETHYRRAVETGSAEAFEAYYPPPLDGYYAVRVFPFKEGLSVYFRDVTEEKRAEAALRESEERLRLVGKATNDAVWDWDMRTDAIVTNPAFGDLFGWRDEAAAGFSSGWMVERVHPDDRARALDAFRGITEGTETSWVSEHRFERADGTWVDVLERGYVVREGGVPVRTVGTMLDLTTQKAMERALVEAKRAEAALRESEERLRLVGQATNDAVWDWDVPSRAVVMNEAFIDVFGWRDPPDGGFTIDWMLAHVHPDEQGRVFGVLLDIFKGRGQHWEDEYRFERADGTWADVVTRGHIVRSADGRAVRIVGTMLDLTARKATERALVEAKEAAIEAREAAEEVARAKSSLLDNMSHEIRTPLTAVLGYAEMLAAEAPADLQDLVEPIWRGGQRLLDTLNSVLDLAQIEAGALALTPVAVDLWAEAKATVAALQPLAQMNGLALTLTGFPAAALVDQAALARVLTNLVGNAIKFTEAGGVHVEVGAAGSAVWVRVTDTGIGMPAEFLPHVFDEFKQVSEGHDRSHEGNGLGLTITKRLVDLMGGEIEVESTLGRGTTFTVMFPAAVDSRMVNDPTFERNETARIA